MTGTARAWLLAATLTAACSPNEGVDDQLEDSDFGLPADDTSQVDTAAGDTGEPAPDDLAYWSLEGTLGVNVEGELLVEGSAFAVHYWTRSGERWAPPSEDVDTDGNPIEVPPCVRSATLVSAEPLSPPDNNAELLWTWWDLLIDESPPADTSEPPVDRCEQPLPSAARRGPNGEARLYLGIGQPDDRLVPAMVQAGLDPTLPLPAVYLRPLRGGPGDLVVFGVAGTASMLDGTVPPPDQPPLTAGGWRIVPLYTLALPD